MVTPNGTLSLSSGVDALAYQDEASDQLRIIR